MPVAGINPRLAPGCRGEIASLSGDRYHETMPLDRQRQLSFLPPKDAIRFDWFPWAVALTLTICIISYRAAHGISLGPNPASDRIGFVFNASDNLSYASWAQQARAGQIFFSDLYTTTEHRRLLFNPYFLIVGIIAHHLSCHVIAVMNVLGLIAAFGTIVAGYVAARSIGLPQLAARLGCIFLAAGSGLSGAAIHIQHACNVAISAIGSDLGYFDSIATSTFFLYPYHSVSLFLVAIALLAIAHAFRRATFVRLMLVALAAAVVSAVHPYEIILLLGGAAVAIAVSRSGDRRNAVLILLAASIGALPAFAYSAYVATQPVWDDFSHASLNLPRGRFYWTIGYGAPMALAMYASIRLVRGRVDNSEKVLRSPAVILVAWIWALAILLIGVNISQTRICNGGPIAVCILAGFGLSDLWARGRPGKIVAVIAMIASISNQPYLLRHAYSDWPMTYPHELDALLSPISQSPGASSVLCDAELANQIPGLYGLRVYVGHVALTPFAEQKQARVAAAGMTGDELESFEKRPAGIGQLQREARCQYLLLRKSPDRGDTIRNAEYELISRTPHFVLLRLR